MNNNIFKDISILVVGDVMLDKYVYGDINRISGEAPVLILDVDKKRSNPGGAANVAVNLSNLKINTFLAGKIGHDSEGNELKRLLKKENLTFHYIDDIHSTTVKTRFVSKNQQLLRTDEENRTFLNDDKSISLFYKIEDLIKNKSINMIIISDYEKGVCSNLFCYQIINCANEYNIPVIVDPKGDNWEKYNNVHIIAPNVKELAQICNCKVSNEDNDIIEIGKEVYNSFKMDYLLVTRSEKGATLINKDIEHHVPSSAKEVFDVSGAGDTLIAVLSGYLSIGENIKNSIDMAMKAAEIVIGKAGTIPITYKELIGEK